MAFFKSAEEMAEVPDGSVDLVVTSPPYWGAIISFGHFTEC